MTELELAHYRAIRRDLEVAEDALARCRKERDGLYGLIHEHAKPIEGPSNPDGEHLAPNGKPIDGYPLQQA